MSEPAVLVSSGTAQLMGMASAWGFYALIFAISVFLLVNKGVRQSRPRQILLFSTCLMFAASTALAAVDTGVYLVQFSDGDYIPASNKLQLACEVLFDSLFLMGDTIVLWRTWMLCPDRRLLVLSAIALWFGGFTCVLSILGVALQNGFSSGWRIGVYDTSTTLKLSMATAGLSAATNFFSTFLISWKAWQHRAVFNTQSTCGAGSRARKIMSLFIESGFIYFGLWVIAMLNFYLDWRAPVLQAILRGLYDMVIGMYPTLIIILVHLDCSFWGAVHSTTTVGTRSAELVTTLKGAQQSFGTIMLIGPDIDKNTDTDSQRRW
ncbi:hypothetical protein C8R43DRAFT_126962 [Mycena crocata]|nr:hypothetical protein C8R43DRAFT_126962 [Mycena crocata]